MYVKGEDEFLALALSRMSVSVSPLSRTARNVNMYIICIYNTHIGCVGVWILFGEVETWFVTSEAGLSPSDFEDCLGTSTLRT